MAQRSAGEDSDDDDAVEAAAQRLERALTMLESRVKELSTRASAGGGSLFDFDRSKLADELDASRARQRDLEEAGAEASQALGRAIEGIRRALGETEDA
jgi:hypothetical protein